MKFTICVTQRCNLRCSYCYIGKNASTMDAGIAAAVVDWMFARTADEETVDVGLFGGEPLLAFDVVRRIVGLIESHPRFDRRRIVLSVISNGTIFSEEIAHFLGEHGIHYCLSFDGLPEVQNRFRRFADGRPSADVVEQNARAALAAFEWVPVNAVYRPETFRRLPESIRYLAGLGIRQIYLSPDLCAPWTSNDVDALPDVFEEIADLYIDAHLRGAPLFIGPIDGKITVMLRGGYRPEERCQMGKAEFAFTPDGKIYPCERLIGCGGDAHRIGSVTERGGAAAAPPRDAGPQPECLACTLRDYCMNWCGCSNFFATGDYGRTGPVMCAAERAALTAAARAWHTVEERLGPTFMAHLTGHPSLVATGTF